MKPSLELTTLQEAPLAGKRVFLLGTLGGLTKRESAQVVRQSGGRLQEILNHQVQVLVVARDHPGVASLPEFDDALKASVAKGDITVIPEAELWELLSERDDHDSVRQLYTPAMLAELLDIPIRLVRRWYRTGLIQPVKEVLHLPYFDYAELSTARQLAKWCQEGATVQSIQRQLAALSELAPVTDRPIQQLSITVEGKQLLMRHGSTLVESTGQFRFSFDDANDALGDQLQTISIANLSQHRAGRIARGTDRSGMGSTGNSGTGSFPQTLDQIVEQAMLAEDEEDLDGAVDWYRTALAAFGPNADVCFQLAELLYRQGDATAARERYYMALELDEGLVEARANLGCVLSELGQFELAIAAFEGTLKQFEEYADVHFHLARALDDLGQTSKANHHWQRFLELAPASPWAEEAHQRLSQLSPSLEF